MDAHIEKLEAQLDAWQLRLKELSEGTDRNDYPGRIADLEAKHAAARAKLDALKAAGNDKWDLYKADIWIVWNELENKLEDYQQSVPKTTPENSG